MSIIFLLVPGLLMRKPYSIALGIPDALCIICVTCTVTCRGRITAAQRINDHLERALWSFRSGVIILRITLATNQIGTTDFSRAAKHELHTSNTRLKCFESFWITRLYGRCWVNFLLVAQYQRYDGVVSAEGKTSQTRVMSDALEARHTAEAGHSTNVERQEQNQARSMSERLRLVRVESSIPCLISLVRSCVRTTQICAHSLVNRTTGASIDTAYVMWD